MSERKSSWRPALRRIFSSRDLISTADSFEKQSSLNSKRARQPSNSSASSSEEENPITYIPYVPRHAATDFANMKTPRTLREARTLHAYRSMSSLRERAATPLHMRNRDEQFADYERFESQLPESFTKVSQSRRTAKRPTIITPPTTFQSQVVAATPRTVPAARALHDISERQNQADSSFYLSFGDYLKPNNESARSDLYEPNVNEKRWQSFPSPQTPSPSPVSRGDGYFEIPDGRKLVPICDFDDDDDLYARFN